MKFISINDYELIYLIRDHNEVALNLLFKKYIPLIKAKICEFNVNSYYYEEFFQECLMALNDAIRSFDEENGASFSTYLNIIITRKIIITYRNIVTNDVSFNNLENVIKDNSSKYGYEIDYFEEGMNLFKTDIDRTIYYETYREGLCPREISRKHNYDIKAVYNRIQKIKKALKQLNID